MSRKFQSAAVTSIFAATAELQALVAENNRMREEIQESYEYLKNSEGGPEAVAYVLDTFREYVAPEPE